MKEKSKIYFFEPVIFLFFGIFHLHRIWGLVDRSGYAKFWLGIMNNRGVLYFVLMGILSALCVAGIVVFVRNIGKNYLWRLVYIFGGGYLLFDLFAIAIKLNIWNSLLLMMFDTASIYWNILWGMFILMGILSGALGLHIIKKMTRAKGLN